MIASHQQPDKLLSQEQIEEAPPGSAGSSTGTTAAGHWRRVKKLFLTALDMPPDERARWLGQHDPELRRPVESLLACHDQAGDFLDAPAWPEPPEVFDVGPYRTLERIGEGGMGVVYRAQRADDAFSKQVCVKVIRQGGEVARRFRAERQILARLEHPNIARLIDGGTTAEGLPYLVMEYVDGEPIDRYCDRHHLPVPDRLELFRDVCSAVHDAHRHLIVHRDLKPSNILVSREGTPKLLDFGIAKLLDPAPGDETMTGWWAMTPEYASPEQLAGEPVTTASDVYSLGVLLFLLLTGRRPYQVDRRTPWTLVRQVFEEAPATASRCLERTDLGGLSVDEVAARRGLSPRRLERRLAGDLDVIVGRALERDPRQRYGSPQQLAEDLRRHLAGEPIRARPTNLFYRLRKRVRRSPIAASALVLAALLAVGATALGLRAQHQREVAERARERAESLSSFLFQLFESSDPESPQGDPDLSARDILDRGAAAVEPSFAGRPAEEGRFRDQLGRIYLHLGDFEKAREMLEGALEAHRRLSPAATAATLSRLAALELRSGDPRRARSLAEESLALFEQALGSQHPEAVTALANLGSTLFENGYPDDAEPLLVAALARQPPDGAQAATTRANLGHLSFQRGDWSRAEGLLLTAVGDFRRLFGERDPRTLDALARLAATLQRQGERRRAEVLLREVLTIQREVLGDDHPDVAVSRNNLGLLLRELDQLPEAEKLLRQALESNLSRLGEAHAFSVMARTALAAVILDAGRRDEARGLFAKAVELGRQVFPAGDANLSHPLMGLGRSLLEERPQAAQRAFGEALELRRRAWGHEHWRSIEARGLWAVSRWSQGDGAAGEEIRRAAAELEERLGADHPAARELSKVRVTTGG